MFAPAASAILSAAWIVGPSAIGSENGIPSSMISTTHTNKALHKVEVYFGEGSPAVRKPMRALRPSFAAVSKACSILVIKSNRH